MSTDEDYDYGYLWEKFYSAVNTLASGTGTIQSRLTDATMLNILLFKPEEIPDAIRNRFIALCDQLTANTDTNPGEGSLQASVGQLSDEEARQMASEIVSLFDYITKRDTE